MNRRAVDEGTDVVADDRVGITSEGVDTLGAGNVVEFVDDGLLEDIDNWRFFCDAPAVLVTVTVTITVSRLR